MLYMLDTDTASYVIKSRPPQIQAKLASIPQSDVCISVMTRAELMFGLKRLPANHPVRFGVRQFLKIVKCVPWDDEAADQYADIRHQLSAAGQLIGEIDMMIAAHSLAAGAILVSNNVKHYERIGAPLILVNWAN